MPRPTLWRSSPAPRPICSASKAADESWTMMESLMNRTTDDLGDGHLDTSSPTERSRLARDHGYQDHGDNTVATIASVAIVGIGAAVFEAALVPGIIIGAAATWLPSNYPKMGEALEPLLRAAAGGINTFNVAATVFDLSSGVGRLGLRGSPRHRPLAGLSPGLRALGANRRRRHGGARRR
jgi:hypothetical protein